MLVQSLGWVPCTAACVERSDFFLGERGRPVQEMSRRGWEHKEACARPLLSAGACRPGVCGNYRRLTFRTQGKGWVKVQLIPFKEKKKNSSSLTFQSFDPDQSEATRARNVWRERLVPEA